MTRVSGQKRWLAVKVIGAICRADESAGAVLEVEVAGEDLLDTAEASAMVA
jgi:hypothetical protein